MSNPAPTTPKRSKQFLELLIERKNIPFNEVLEFFTNSKGKWSQSVISTIIHHLWNEDLFDIKKKSSDLEFWGNEDLFFESPEDCYLELIDFNGSETVISEGYASTFARKGGLSKMDKHYYWANIELENDLRITGDPGKANNLAERIRAFTHYFAYNLTNRNYEKVESLISKHIRNENSAAMIEEIISKQETTYGAFELFDHVSVRSVFCGENSETNSSEGIKLPKGVTMKDRRGRSSFQLVSTHTPNGVAIFSYYVDLSIIEEDNVFKICSIRWHTGGF